MLAQEDARGVLSQIKVTADFVDVSREALHDFYRYIHVLRAIANYGILGQEAYAFFDWSEEGGG